MKTYVCYYCGFKMNARKRPNACPVCSKKSHERQRDNYSGVQEWRPRNSRSGKNFGSDAVECVKQSCLDALGKRLIPTILNRVGGAAKILLKILWRFAVSAISRYNQGRIPNI